MVTFCACNHEHEWLDATCMLPKRCAVCSKRQGEALGHTWQDATCEEPEKCVTCAMTKGGSLGHRWQEATCNTPSICKLCNELQGDALGHNFVGGSCSNLGKCSRCEVLQDDYSHNWKDATCTSPKQCSSCGITEGTSLGHTAQNGKCTRCGITVLTAKDMEVDYVYQLINGRITKTTLPRPSIWGGNGTPGFILYEIISNAPTITNDMLIVRTYLMSYIGLKKVEFEDDRYYDCTSFFKKIGDSLYYNSNRGNQQVESINGLTGDLPIEQLPLATFLEYKNEYFLYGSSPNTKHTVGYWDGPDYIEAVFTTPHIKYQVPENDIYSCKLLKTYDGYAVVDTSSLETGYYITYGFRDDGLIYIDNG